MTRECTPFRCPRQERMAGARLHGGHHHDAGRAQAHGEAALRQRLVRVVAQRAALVRAPHLAMGLLSDMLATRG